MGLGVSSTNNAKKYRRINSACPFRPVNLNNYSNDKSYTDTFHFSAKEVLIIIELNFKLYFVLNA